MSQETRIIEMKQNGEIESLAYLLNNESEWMLRLDAAEALAQLGDERGLDYLTRALDDPDTDIGDVAKEILEGLNDPLGHLALQRPRTSASIRTQPVNNSYLRQIITILGIAGAILSFEYFGDGAIVVMIIIGIVVYMWYRFTGSRHKTKGTEIIEELQQKGDIDGLHKILNNEQDWMLRLDAAEVLAQSGNARGLDFLINALDDSDTEVREVANEILEELDIPRGNEALQQPRKPISPRSKPVSNSFSRQVITVLGVAGILILVDSFSWSSGGMNGLGSMIVVFLAILIIGSMFLGRLAGNLLNVNKGKTTETQPTGIRKHLGPIIFGIIILILLLLSLIQS